MKPAILKVCIIKLCFKMHVNFAYLVSLLKHKISLVDAKNSTAEAPA